MVRTGSTSQFGALIDPSFIVGVDIKRGSFSDRKISQSYKFGGGPKFAISKRRVFQSSKEN